MVGIATGTGVSEAVRLALASGQGPKIIGSSSRQAGLAINDNHVGKVNRAGVAHLAGHCKGTADIGHNRARAGFGDGDARIRACNSEAAVCPVRNNLSRIA